MRRNLNSQLSGKLDYKKVNLFLIKKKISIINYELELSKKIKIYLVFHILLLEFTDLITSIYIKKILEFTQNNKYKIKKITEYNFKT